MVGKGKVDGDDHDGAVNDGGSAGGGGKDIESENTGAINDGAGG